MARSRRDKNEAALIELWRGAGCVVIQMDRYAGFDLLVIHRGKIYIVEIKDGSKWWKLRPAEQKRLEEITQRTAAHYNIVTNEQQALEMLGLQ